MVQRMKMSEMPVPREASVIRAEAEAEFNKDSKIRAEFQTVERYAGFKAASERGWFDNFSTPKQREWMDDNSKKNTEPVRHAHAAISPASAAIAAVPPAPSAPPSPAVRQPAPLSAAAAPTVPGADRYPDLVEFRRDRWDKQPALRAAWGDRWDFLVAVRDGKMTLDQVSIERRKTAGPESLAIINSWSKP